MAWQENTEPSACEAGGQASLISWHSYIGIPINFHEESGIITFLSIELSATLDVSKGSEPTVQRGGELWLSLGTSQGIWATLHLVR